MTDVAVFADMSVLWLGLRLVFSLAIVLGLIVALTWAAKRGKGLGLGAGGRTRKGAIEVRARHQLSRSTTVALLEVGDRALLIASNDQSIEVIAEGEDLLPAEEPAAVETDDRTSSQVDPTGSTPAGMSLIEVLREWSLRRA